MVDVNVRLGHEAVHYVLGKMQKQGKISSEEAASREAFFDSFLHGDETRNARDFVYVVNHEVELLSIEKMPKKEPGVIQQKKNELNKDLADLRKHLNKGEEWIEQVAHEYAADKVAGKVPQAVKAAAPAPKKAEPKVAASAMPGAMPAVNAAPVVSQTRH